MEISGAFFALLRTVLCDETADEKLKNACTHMDWEAIYTLAKKHDLVHMVGQAAGKMHLPESDILKSCKQAAVIALGRYLHLEQAYNSTCQALEAAQIPFLPLKGSVLRAYYPEPWMRTSCDVDILVHPEDVDKAVKLLEEKLSYRAGGRGAHDVSLYCPSGVCVELHFALVEKGRANAAGAVLDGVWENATLKAGYGFWHEMSDGFFYFYHIAHMVKHFEGGGCGIRPFIDLWILDNLPDADFAQRNRLLEQGELLQFAQIASKLSRVWMCCEEPDQLTQKMESFLLRGGTYGSTENRVALHQSARGGKCAYIMSRVFAPYEKLKSSYPILEKHRWLMPVMQVRRWFLLLRRPDLVRMAKSELVANQSRQDDVGRLLEEIGIHHSSW